MGREKKRGSPQQVEETRCERPNLKNLDVRLRHKWLGEKKRGSPQHVISWGEVERPNSSNLNVRLIRDR